MHTKLIHSLIYLFKYFILDVQFRSFKTERISAKENDKRMTSRLKELFQGNDLKNSDIFSDLESNKWSGKLSLFFIFNVHSIYILFYSI